MHIFHAAKEVGHYKCFLRDNTLLPMMYLPDCIRATIEMMDVPAEKLKSRVYNVTAMSFTPAQLLEEMKRYYPHLTVEYEPDSRQQIGMSLKYRAPPWLLIINTCLNFYEWLTI